jgi:hypothetical protein
MFNASTLILVPQMADNCVFPGMFIIIALLAVVEAIFSKSGVDNVMDVFAPALNWIQRWLPLFYVPSLVIIPLALNGIAGRSWVSPYQYYLGRDGVKS